MKFSPVWYVVFGLTAIIILLLLFDKPQETDTSAWQDEIHRKNTKIKELTLKHSEDSVKFAHKLAELRDSLKKVEIHTVKLERSIAKIKANPVIIKVRDSIKVVDDAFITYDSTLAAKNEEIRIQGKMIASLEDENARITSNFIERLSLANENFVTQKEISDALEKDLKKSKRGAKFAKILIPIVGVGMFLLGSQ